MKKVYNITKSLLRLKKKKKSRVKSSQNPIFKWPVFTNRLIN